MASQSAAESGSPPQTSENLVLPAPTSQLPKLADATGWQLRDLQGVICTERRAAADWLDTQNQFVSQPWQEIAAAYERNGQPADARWMRYQAAVRSTRNTKSRASRAGQQIYRATTGHGYYPLLALGWLLMIFAVALGVTAATGDRFTAAATETIRDDLATRAGTDEPVIPDPLVDGRVPLVWCAPAWDTVCLDTPSYALAIAVPAIGIGITQPWQPPSGWPTTTLQILRVASWVFTALRLAGVTGLLRKQT